MSFYPHDTLRHAQIHVFPARGVVDEAAERDAAPTGRKVSLHAQLCTSPLSSVSLRGKRELTLVLQLEAVVADDVGLVTLPTLRETLQVRPVVGELHEVASEERLSE